MCYQHFNGRPTSGATRVGLIILVALAVIATALIWSLNSLSVSPASSTSTTPNDPAPPVESPISASAPMAKPIASSLSEPSATQIADNREATKSDSVRKPGIYLHVHVVGPTGGPILHGRLSCRHGAVLGDDPQLIERVDLPIDGDSTLLRIPLTSERAFLTALVDHFPPEQVFLDDLRRSGGHWLGENESADREVVIKLGAQPSIPSIRGSVGVDGAPQLPADLCVRALINDRANRSESEARPRMAVLDPASATFELRGLANGEWTIEATSSETIPRWVPVLMQSDRGTRVIDLDLVRGTRTCLEVRDAKTRAPASDIDLIIRYFLPTERSETEVRLFRQTTLSVRSGPNGVCRCGALPAGIEISIYQPLDLAQVVDIARVQVFLHVNVIGPTCCDTRQTFSAP